MKSSVDKGETRIRALGSECIHWMRWPGYMFHPHTFTEALVFLSCTVLERAVYMICPL